MSARRVARSSSRRSRAGDVSPARRAARYAAAAMRDGQANANAAFDHLLPAELRKVSGDYWTPLPVIRRVASWLRAERVDTVVDIGSGAGKFCVVTALMTSCRVIGLEQRPSLVASAQALAALCELEDRVTFVTGAFGNVPTPKGSAYYLFNPFGEYAFSAARDADDDVVFSEQAYTRDVDAMTRFLARAPFGTVVITYNGFGADLPPSYEQIRADLTFRAALRLWKKRRPPTNARTSFRRFTPVIHMPDP